LLQKDTHTRKEDGKRTERIRGEKRGETREEKRREKREKREEREA
jgi:hypothetical protein